MDSERLLDDVGWRILKELQQDARLSYAELGRRVGLTLPAVAERVRRMEEAGIIRGYRVRLNREKLGLPITAYIRVATENEVKGGQLVAMARELPEVLECHRVTGDDSYLMRVAVTSVQHLEWLLSKITPHGQPTTSIILSSPITQRVIDPAGLAQMESRLSGVEGSHSVD
ncbi:MAG: Lrp/AsnC family transcriptional regulator [Sphingomonadaceae bacterium]